MATLKGIFPNPKPTRRKNFIQENVKNLRRMEQFFQTKEIEDLQKLQLQKKSFDKYQNVTARINSSLRSSRNSDPLGKPALRHSEKNLAEEKKSLQRKVSAPIAQKSAENKKVHRNSMKLNLHESREKSETDKKSNIRRASSHSNLIQEPVGVAKNLAKNDTKLKHQGVQTLDCEDVATLYKEGIIRYPSGRKPTNGTSPTRNAISPPPREFSSSPSDRGDETPISPQRQSYDRLDSLPAGEEHVDRLKLNKLKISPPNKVVHQTNNGEPPANYRKGVVPKYIREIKEARQQREEEMKAAALNADCPRGHILLPDNERKETLGILKKQHGELVSELNMMPIKTDTLRSQRRKMEIEKQLTKLEEGIKVFSRPKVYVTVNA